MNQIQINNLKQLYGQAACGGYFTTEKEQDLKCLKHLKCINKKMFYICDICDEKFISKLIPTQCPNLECNSNQFSILHTGYAPKIRLQTFLEKNIPALKKEKEFVIEYVNFTDDELPISKISRTASQYIYISPLFTMHQPFRILSPALNHVILNWKQALKYNKKLSKKINCAIIAAKKNQLMWDKIDENSFQDLALDIAKILKYTKIIPGGTGPDQGSDGSALSPLAKPTLIQAKHTPNKNYGFRDIHTYIMTAEAHNKDHLLFVTSGSLSGTARNLTEKLKGKTGSTVEVVDGATIKHLITQFECNTIFQKYFNN